MAKSDKQIKVGINKGIFTLKNAQLTPFGGIKCNGWRTLRGFIRILKQQNKLLARHNIQAKFEITLPIPK